LRGTREAILVPSATIAAPIFPCSNRSNSKLAFNLKTAKAIGIEVPQMLMARADEIIE
jgi:hypothetical protein